jgi:hypothetical protein
MQVDAHLLPYSSYEDIERLIDPKYFQLFYDVKSFRMDGIGSLILTYY